MNASGFRSNVRHSAGLAAWPVTRATRFADPLWILAVALASICGSFAPARAELVIGWVTEGDPGNIGHAAIWKR